MTRSHCIQRHCFHTNCTLFDRIIPTFFSFLVFSFPFPTSSHTRITSVRLVTFFPFYFGWISAWRTDIPRPHATLCIFGSVWGGYYCVWSHKWVLGLWDGGVGHLCVLRRTSFALCFQQRDLPFEWAWSGLDKMNKSNCLHIFLYGLALVIKRVDFSSSFLACAFFFAQVSYSETRNIPSPSWMGVASYLWHTVLRLEKFGYLSCENFQSLQYSVCVNHTAPSYCFKTSKLAYLGLM